MTVVSSIPLCQYVSTDQKFGQTNEPRCREPAKWRDPHGEEGWPVDLCPRHARAYVRLARANDVEIEREDLERIG